MFFEKTIIIAMLYNISQDITYFKLPNGLHQPYDLVLRDKYTIFTLKEELSHAMKNFTPLADQSLTNNKFQIMNLLFKISITILLLAILSYFIYFVYRHWHLIKGKSNNHQAVHYDQQNLLPTTTTSGNIEIEMVSIKVNVY